MCFPTKRMEAYVHGWEKEESEPPWTHPLVPSHFHRACRLGFLGRPGGFPLQGLPPSGPSVASPCSRFQIRGTEKSNVRELHIAYRYGEHYDSVRRVNDNSEAPAHLQTDVSEASVCSCSLSPEGAGARAGCPELETSGVFMGTHL